MPGCDLLLRRWPGESAVKPLRVATAQWKALLVALTLACGVLDLWAMSYSKKLYIVPAAAGSLMFRSGPWDRDHRSVIESLA